VCTWTLLTFTSDPAVAQDPTVEARAAYDRGAAAYDAHDYATAATELARADQLAPNYTALDLALQAAMRAGNGPLVMELVARVDARIPPSSPLYVHAHEAAAKLANAVGRVVVHCPPPATFCKASMEGRNLSIEVPFWTTVGDHAIDLETDGAPEHRTIHVQAGQFTEIKPEAPATAAPSSSAPTPPKPAATAPVTHLPPPVHVEPKRNGLSPNWVILGGAATLVAGGFTAWSALDTQDKHDAFNRAPTSSGQSAGRDAELRTNILIATTAGLGLATAVVGVFFVGWSSGPTATVAGRF